MPEPERGGARDVVIAGAGSAGELLFDCLKGGDRWNVVALFLSVRGGREAATRSARRP